MAQKRGLQQPVRRPSAADTPHTHACKHRVAATTANTHPKQRTMKEARHGHQTVWATHRLRRQRHRPAGGTQHECAVSSQLAQGCEGIWASFRQLRHQACAGRATGAKSRQRCSLEASQPQTT